MIKGEFEARMNNCKLQVGDLVKSTEWSFGVGLVISFDEIYKDDQCAEVYWFKLGKIMGQWPAFLTKLETSNE
jgi:hypothetical protein